MAFNDGGIEPKNKGHPMVTRGLVWGLCGVLGIALSSVSSTAAATDDMIEFSMDLHSSSGDVSAAQRQDLLRQDWQVSALYYPKTTALGLNSSWSHCGFFSTPCLQADVERMTLPATAVRREGEVLYFALPKRSPERGFSQLEQIAVRTLLKNKQRYPFALEFSTSLGAEGEGTSHFPVVLDGGSYLLEGTMRVQGRSFTGRADCGLLTQKECLAWDEAQGRYTFRNRHPYALYFQKFTPQNVFDAPPTELKKPYPSALAQVDIRQAQRFEQQKDGHTITLIHIEGNDARLQGTCSSDDVTYQILWVDQQLVAYSRRYPDPDPKQCVGHVEDLEWGEKGELIMYTGMRVDWVNQGSRVRYFDWNIDCPRIDSNAFQSCNVPPANAQKLAEVRAQAQKVRSWFK